ncbi:MAG: proline iminopeptidase-family hydrolase [Acidobacteria bacterium]|nr:proline iminopeptidase-family hydrolase [Acidobacteriota bacterium]
MRRAVLLFLVLSVLLAGCASLQPAERVSPGIVPAGGDVRMVPIETPKGTFHVWTKTVGDNPQAKVLLLHGGPGATHEYLNIFENFLPPAGIEIILYDQLGSKFSDQPDEPELWETDRFVDEVEQVRQALGLDRDNFYLYGSSWGGILAIEYALEHQEHLKGLIISNMMSSIPAYNDYAHDVLMPAMDQNILNEILALEETGDTQNPRYMELLVPNWYELHVLRKPIAEWPADVTNAFHNINPKIYVPMQGPSEMGASGKLVNWDRSGDLHEITVPTLVIGAQYDTMNPEHMEWMSKQFPKGQYLYIPNGAHLAMYDDPERYFEGIIRFIEQTMNGRDVGPGL